MLKAVAPLVLLAAVLQGISAQEIDFGKCPKMEGKHDFNLDSYLGTWYQHSTWGTRAIQGTGKCVKSSYTYDEKSGLVELVKTQIPLSKPARATVKGTIRFQNPQSGEAKMLMSVNMPVIKKATFPYTILGTDYVSWSVSYACVDFFLFHIWSTWIHTRDPNPGEYLMDEVETVVKKMKLTTSRYRKTDQKDCTYPQT